MSEAMIIHTILKHTMVVMALWAAAFGIIIMLGAAVYAERDSFTLKGQRWNFLIGLATFILSHRMISIIYLACL